MRKLNLLAILTIAALSVSVPAGYAASPTPANGQKSSFLQKMDTKRKQLYDELGLNNEQRKLLEANKDKHREQTKALFSQIHQNMDLLRQELEKNELDMQAIYKTNNELKELQAQMFDNRLERILEVRKILTPEQFKKFEEKMNKRMSHFKNRDKYGKDR